MIMTQCEIGKIGLIEKDILLVEIENESEIEATHVSQLRSVAAQLSKSKKIYNIINSGAYSLPTREARELYVKYGMNSHVLGRAFVVHDLGQFILAKHILKHKESKIPTKIFMDINKAQNWVKELKSKNHDPELVTSK